MVVTVTPIQTIDANLREAQSLARSGRLVAARDRCEALKKVAPADVRVWRLAAEIALRGRRPDEALGYLKSAAVLAPDNLALQLEHAGCLLRLGRRGDALTLALQLRGCKFDRSELWDALGTLLTHCGRADYALPVFEKAVQASPTNIDFRYNLAMAQRMVGALKSSEANLDKVLEARPSDTEAHLARSGLRKQTKERNHVEELTRAWHMLKNSRTGTPVLFALAKELEDLGEYQQSWAFLSCGAARHRRTFKYDVRTDVETVDWIMEAFNPLKSQHSGRPDAAPIFIVGMPRTGSTLLERILSWRSDVRAAGELTDFAVALISCARTQSTNCSSRRELITAAATIDSSMLGADYLARVRSLIGSSIRFTDKMPLNYLYCGWLRSALPNARILHLTRHPLATCYAVFKTLFNQAYPFSYDLGELADYYIAYRRLMDYWHQVLPGQILDISYERLVTDPEAQLKSAFDFCGLEWDPGCLDMSRDTYVSTTASAVQVRQPIHRSSVDLWRAYRNELNPVAQRLLAAGIPI